MKRFLLLLLLCSAILFSQAPRKKPAAPAATGSTPAKKAAEARVEYRWDVQPSGVEDDLAAVSFVNTSLGWAAGKGNTILKTTDGGNTWTRLMERQEGRNDFKEISFTSPTDGWAHGRVLLHTSDGGESWQPASPLPGSMPGFGGGHVRGATRYQMHGTTSGQGVYRSDDSGRTWKMVAKPPRNDYEAVFFFDDQNGWVSGDYGRFALTHDGGATWTELQPLNQAHFTKIQFVSPQIGWLLPYRGHQGGPLATTDGGNTWTNQYAGVESSRPMADFQFLDAQHGFLLAEGNRSDYVFHTANGGKSWRTIGSLQKYSAALSFPKLDEGWVVGRKGYIVHYHRVEPPK